MKLAWIRRLDSRLGLMGKMVLALAVGGLLTALVAAVAWLSFRQVVEFQRRIIDDTVPALEVVGAVTQLNTRALALVDQLRLARSVDEVQGLERQGLEQLGEVRRLLTQLERHVFEHELARPLKLTVDEMRANLALQAATATRSLKLQSELRTALASRQQAVAELMLLAEALAANASTFSAATVSGLYPMLERGASQAELMASLDRLIEVDIDRMERMTELQLVCFRLKTTLDQVESAPSVPALSQRYAADLDILTRRLEDFRDPTRKAFALRHRQVLAGALADNGLFALQGQRLALEDELAAQREAGAALSARLNNEGRALLQASRHAVEQVGIGSREVTAQGALGFAAVAVMLVLALLATLWLVFRYELLGRLKAMEGAMRALMAGQHDVRIEHRHASLDPLAPLAQALEQFREHAIERQRLEQSLRQHHQRLEQEVQDRTAEITRSHQLLEREVELHAQARREAEEANRTKNEFLGSLSHELRTPLSGVGGSVNLLRDTALDERQREYVRMIGYANNTLLETLDDMLGFARLEAGKLDVSREAFSLTEVVDDMLALQAVSARNKGLALVRDIGRDVPERLVGDRRKLNQILLNTIGNAVKFTDEGEVTVTVERLPVQGGALWLRFEVSDTGIGIPAAQLDAVFKPFYQVEDTAHRRHGGTGLGLAICQRLVELMGGRVTLQSAEREGTTIGFELPFDVAAAQVPLSVEEPADAAPVNVLLVEDDEVNRIVCQRYLEALGHRFQAVDSGPAAIQALEHGASFDCVLMDMSLPGRSGLEVTQTIRRLHGGRWESLPVIGMSAHVTPETLSHPAASSMAGFLRKPFQRGELARALARAVSRAGVQGLPVGVQAAVAVAEPVLDEAYLEREREDLGLPTLRHLLDLFEREADAAMVELDQNQEPPDREAAGRRAHKLMSSAGNLGLRRVSARCREIEASAETTPGPAPDLAQLVGGLRDELRLSLAALREWLDARQAGDQVDPAPPASR